MNVFVLCTGRSGSNAVEAACKHITNFSCAHESRATFVGDARVAYADNHIEIDHYLSWFLGRLDQAYGDDAYYVHLTRDPEKVARTWLRWWWWQGSSPRAYRNAFLKMTNESKLDCTRDYVRTKTENIRHFLKGKPHTMNMRMENIEDDFRAFWTWIGAEGDLEAALSEFSKRHNATPSKLRMAWRFLHNLAGRALRFYR